MKICKVTLIKRLNGNRCDNIPPQYYDPQKIHVISYDENPLEEGDNIGYCIGMVADDFEFTKDMVEIPNEDAKTFIDERSGKEKTDKNKTKYKKRKEYLV